MTTGVVVFSQDGYATNTLLSLNKGFIYTSKKNMCCLSMNALTNDLSLSDMVSKCNKSTTKPLRKYSCITGETGTRIVELGLDVPVSGSSISTTEAPSNWRKRRCSSSTVNTAKPDT